MKGIGDAKYEIKYSNRNSVVLKETTSNITYNFGDYMYVVSYYFDVNDICNMMTYMSQKDYLIDAFVNKLNQKWQKTDSKTWISGNGCTAHYLVQYNGGIAMYSVTIVKD